MIDSKERIWNICTRVYPKFVDWPPGARTANGTDLCH